MSGYLRHIELSRQLEKKAKEASENRQRAEDRLQQLHHLVEAAKKADCPVDEAEALLAQANSAVGAKDYKLALEKTREGEDKARAAFVQHTEKVLDSSEAVLHLLRQTELDTSEFSALLSSARDALEKGDFEAGLETAKRGWTKLEKTLHEHLSESFSSVQNRVLAAQALEKDTSTAEDLLAQARGALDASDYKEALNQTQEALGLLGRELDFEVEREEKVVKELLQAGSVLKADVSQVEAYLGKSKSAMEGGDYEKAIHNLTQARQEAERQLKQSIESGKASLEEPLEQAQKLGVDISSLARTAEDAVAVAKEGDYARASELIRQTLHDLDQAKFRLVQDTIASSRPKFLKAKELKVDIKETVEIFNKARTALQGGDHADALYYAQKGNEELDRLVEQASDAQTRMKALREEVHALTKEGEKLPDMDAILRDAQESLSRGDLKAWTAHVDRAEKALRTARADRCEEVLEEVKFMITLADDLGLNPVEERESMQESSQLLRSGDLARALDQAKNVRDGTEARLDGHFQSEIETLRSSLPQGKEPESITEVLLKAETALEVKDYGTARSLIQEAHEHADTVVRDYAASVLEGLQAAQDLVEAHDMSVDGLREATLAAKRAFEGDQVAQVVKVAQELRSVIRNLTQDAFDRVKANVVEARNKGIDITAQKETLKQAKEAVAQGDLLRGLVHLRDGDLSTQESLDLFKKVHDTMGAAAVLVAEGKKKEVNMTRAVELLMRGKSAFEAGQMERGLELARAARAEAEKELSVLNVTDRILSAKEALELAQAIQVDISPWANLLARAKKSLEKDDFREAVELAMEVESQARSGVRNSVHARIARAEGLLEKVQVAAPEIGELQSDLDTIRSLLEARELADAADRSQTALERAQNLANAYENTVRILREAEGLIPELESMSVKVSGPEKLLSKARKALEDGNLNLSRELGDEALSQLEKERGESIGRTIKSFEASVAKAQKDGINTAKAEKLLSQAREQFAAGAYEEALSLAMQSEAVVEKMGLQKEIAQNALENARKQIVALPTEVPYLTRLLSESETTFEAGDYVKSLEAAINATDELARIRENWEEVETAEDEAIKAYRMAESMGLETEQFDLLGEEAKSATGKGDLDGARETYERLATEATSAVSAHLTQLHNQIRNARVLCSLMDCDVDGLDERLSQGLGYLEEDQYTSAHEVLTGAMETVQTILSEAVETEIQETREILERARELGADVSDAEGRLELANAALEEGVFERAVRLTQEASEALKSQKDIHQRFAQVTTEAERLLKTARKFGIAAKKASKILERALKRKKEDPEAALQDAERSLSMVQEALDAFSPALELALEMEPAVAGADHPGTLTVRNTSKALAKDLEVEVLGDFEVRELDVPPSVRGNGEANVPVRLLFQSPGHVPVLVKTRAKRVIDDRAYEWEEVFEVPVTGA